MQQGEADDVAKQLAGDPEQPVGDPRGFVSGYEELAGGPERLRGNGAELTAGTDYPAADAEDFRDEAAGQEGLPGEAGYPVAGVEDFGGDPAGPAVGPEDLAGGAADLMAEASGGAGPGAVRAVAAEPAAPRPSTGEPRVDAALARLDDLAGRPVTEHRAVFEDVHRRLRDVLGELDSRQPYGDAADAAARTGR